MVTYNSGPEIEACMVAALSQELPGRAIEIIAVDNASTDDSLERLRAFGDRLTLVEHERNAGFAAAMNVALHLSTGDAVLLLNPDCVMDPHCVAALCDHLEAAPGTAVAAAMLRFPDGRPQLFARREPTLGDVVWGLTHVGRRVDRRWRNGRGLARRQYADVFEGGLDKPVPVDCPAAACVLVWRRLVHDRLFDEAFPIVFNDADLYRRLRSRGYSCDVVPVATATHGQGASLKRVPAPRMRAEFVASMRRYAVGHFGLHRRIALWMVLVADAITSGIVSVAGDPNGRSKARAHAKGTLGGLGVPVGADPWLAEVAVMRPRPRSLLRQVGRESRPGMRALARRVRRAAFLVRVRASAAIVGARVDVDVHPSADIARDVLLEIRPRSRSRLVIGERARLQRRVFLRLSGDLDIGPYSEVRVGATLNVSGRLSLEGRNVIGRGAMVHAAGTQVWGFGATVAEYASVIDSNHDVDGSPIHFYDQPDVVADVHLGATCFVGAHAVVTAGVTIGDGAVIGANAVVTRDVPPRSLAVGVPAAVIGDVTGRHGHLDG